MIDSHCSIAGPEFAGQLDAFVARAREAGLAQALANLAADDQVELEQAAAHKRRLGPTSGSRTEFPPTRRGRSPDNPAGACPKIPPRN